MNSNATANRFRLTVVLAVVVAMALGSSWLLLVTKKSGAGATTTEQRTEPDYFVDNFSYVRMTSHGQPKYRLTGDRLIHYPADDSFLVFRPVLVNTGNKGQKQTTVSDRAVVVDENTKIHMYDHVVVDRPAAEDSEPFHMTTDYLLVFPDDEIMQTPDPVVIHKGTSILTGTGMFANNLTKEMKVYGQTKVFLAAPQKEKQ